MRHEVGSHEPEGEAMGDPVLRSVRLDVRERVATLTIDRPAVLNALSLEVLDDLVTACRHLETTREVRVVVLRGAGRTFSAGADLGTMDAIRSDTPDARAAAAAGDRAATAIERLGAVTIAAIHGRCVGGGIVLALACDLRFAAQDARFSIPEVDLGIPLAWGGIPRLLREVGPGVAKDLVLTCREFDAASAASLGLVSRVLPADELDAQVEQVATAVAAKPRVAVEATLDAVAATVGVGPPSGWADADVLLSAARDPESRAAAADYLQRLRGRPGDRAGLPGSGDR